MIHFQALGRHVKIWTGLGFLAWSWKLGILISSFSAPPVNLQSCIYQLLCVLVFYFSSVNLASGKL